MVNQRGKDLIVGAIAGSVLGAVTALLLAPKSGRELRSDIAEGYQQVSEKTQQLAATVSDATTKVAKQVGTQTTQWIDKAKQATTQATAQVREWKAGDNSEEVQEEAAESMEQAVENSTTELTLVRQG